MYASYLPAITSESWKSGSLTLAGSDCEAQERNGIAPCARMSFIGVVGKELNVQDVDEQFANAEANSTSDSRLPVIPSNLDTAFMSQGASVPVSWLPIHAPQ